LIGRSWFRCHKLSADLLRLDQRHLEPEPVVAVAYTVLAGGMVAQGRSSKFERMLGHAAGTLATGGLATVRLRQTRVAGH
jgi:hypothetical protein